MNRLKTFVPLLLALAAIGGLAACGDDDSGSGGSSDGGGGATKAKGESGTGQGAEASKGGDAATPTIVVRNGKPVGGVQELEYSAGERVRFTVRSDAADEVHVHGYDVSREIPAGGSTAISFPADIEGIFEVELHESGGQIAELRVNP